MRRALLQSTVIGRLSRYGAIDDAIEPLDEQVDQPTKWHLLRAGLEVVLLFLVCALVLGGTLFFALPRISPCVLSCARQLRLATSCPR